MPLVYTVHYKMYEMYTKNKKEEARVRNYEIYQRHQEPIKVFCAKNKVTAIVKHEN